MEWGLGDRFGENDMGHSNNLLIVRGVDWAMGDQDSRHTFKINTYKLEYCQHKSLMPTFYYVERENLTCTLF